MTSMWNLRRDHRILKSYQVIFELEAEGALTMVHPYCAIRLLEGVTGGVILPFSVGYFDKPKEALVSMT